MADDQVAVEKKDNLITLSPLESEAPMIKAPGTSRNLIGEAQKTSPLVTEDGLSVGGKV